MMLIVEDGTIVAGADSYVTTADALTYHANHANTSWAAATTAAQEAALRKATAYMDSRYRSRWHGNQVQPSRQALEWPRYLDLYSAAAHINYLSLPKGQTWFTASEIPPRLKDATCEAALRALAGPLLADVDLTVSRETVGPIDTWYTATDIATLYPLLDALLSGLLIPAGGGNLARG